MKKPVVEIDSIDKIEAVKNAVTADHPLYCIKLHINQNITSIAFKKEWEGVPLVIYPAGLGAVRDLTGLLPVLKTLNIKFFLDGAMAQSYEAVQILSSLGIYSGIVINENADWEKLTDLMYYALCDKVLHAPIEPFQYVYDMYRRNMLVDYGMVYFDNPEVFEMVSGDVFTTKGTKEAQSTQETEHVNSSPAHSSTHWQKFFYESTPCAACAAWRICLGKYAALKDKSKCAAFTTNLLQLIENLKSPQLTIN